MTGYIRQSVADIVAGEDVLAQPLNDEFNAIEAAFAGVTGHIHDGSISNGPKIDLVTSVTNVLPIANGGTNATTEAGARTNLGLVIGTNIQAYDAGLTSIAGLTTAADRMIYTTALDTYAVTTLTSFARTLLDDVDATTARATLGANDATNLTTGTVADARLPTTMAGKTFSSALTFSSLTAIVSSNATSGNIIYGGTDGNGAHIELYGGSHATAANHAYYDATQHNFRGQAGSGTPTVTIGGNTVWHAGNDGSGSGLDADHLRGYGPTTGRTANTIVLRDASAGFVSGDITTHRANSTGVIFLGDQTGGARYLHYDGGGYVMPGASLTVGGNVYADNGRFIGADVSKNMVISTDGASGYAGAIYLRPDGEGDTTGQLVITTSGITWNGTSLVRADSGNWAISISGAAATLKQGGSGSGMTFNWSGQAGQPSWLWGGNDGINHYVYNPSNFSVNYANSAGSITSQGSLATQNNDSLVYTGTNVSNVSFPVQSTLFVYTNGTAYARNATVPVFLYTLSNQAFANTGTTGVTGTWRNRGQMASDWVVVERVA